MEHGRSNLTSEKMRILFSDFNELLVKANKYVRLVLCGAVMVEYGVRNMTDEGMLVSKINTLRGAGKNDLDDAKFFIKRLGYNRVYVEKPIPH